MCCTPPLEKYCIANQNDPERLIGGKNALENISLVTFIQTLEDCLSSMCQPRKLKLRIIEQ
jgi:hypothetical protein